MFFKVLNLSEEGAAVEPAEPDEEPILFPLHVYALVTLLGFLVLHVALFTNITRHVSVSKYADPFANDVSPHPRFRQWSGTERMHPSNCKRAEGGGNVKERQQQCPGDTSSPAAAAAAAAVAAARRVGGDGCSPFATKCSAATPALLRRQ